MDLEAVKKWASINYPYLISNEDAIVRLYKKSVLGEVIVEKTKYIAPYRPIAKLEDKIPATIAVTKIVKLRTSSKEVCAVCGKKICTEHTQRVLKYAGVYQMADPTGIVEAFVFETKEFVDGLDKADFLLLAGRYEKNTNGASFIIRSYEVLTKDALKAFYDVMDFFTISSSGGTIQEDKYEKYIKSSGNEIEIRAIEKYFVSKKESGVLYLNL
jgi:hypothetical protein